MQLPGAEFGAFRWGYTVDPPLPGLTAKPLITRDLLPLGSPGAMDLLYALDDRAQSNTLDPASIAPVARLFGADTIWVSNDMAFDRFRTPRPELTHAMFAAQPAGLAAPQPVRARRRRTCRRWRRSTRQRWPIRPIGEPIPPVELVRCRRSPWRWFAPRHAWSCWPAAATASSTHRPPACSTATRRCCTRPTCGLRRSTRRRRSGDRHRLESRPCPPVARHAGRRRIHRDRRAADRRAAARHRRSTPARVRRPVRRAPDDRSGRRARTCGRPATASRSPTGPRIDRRWRSTATRRRHGWWPTGSIRSASASRCRATSPTCRCCSRSSRCVADDLGGAARLRRRRLGERVAGGDLDDASLPGTGQPIDVPAGATSVRITITGVAPRPGGTDPGPSAVGFAELGLGAHTRGGQPSRRTRPVSRPTRRWRSC